MKSQLICDSDVQRQRHFRQKCNVRDVSPGERKLLHGTPLMCFLHRFHSFLSSYFSRTLTPVNASNMEPVSKHFRTELNTQFLKRASGTLQGCL